VIEVAGRGEFARRGGIVDVFPPGRPLPVRIELFGDEIDSLRSFDPTDQRTTERIDSMPSSCRRPSS
jgi:transcription-repair coupling factor (superfamily II helicase)